MGDTHEWLRELRTRLGLRQDQVEDRTAALGEECRVSQSYLSRLERGSKPLAALTPARMHALRQLYRVSPDEWAARTGLQLVSPAAADEVSGQLEFVRVPVRALASAGVPLSDETGGEPRDPELVPRGEYRAGMLVLEVQGNSMAHREGGIHHGDHIYVDTGDLELREGKVYVLHVHGGGWVVKRLRRFDESPGGFWLTSDNPDYPPVRPDQATVIGRVYYHRPQGRRL